MVKGAIEERLSMPVSLCIKHIEDFRNYKVSFEKAANVLSFHPSGNVKSIVGNLASSLGDIALKYLVFKPIEDSFTRAVSGADPTSMLGKIFSSFGLVDAHDVWMTGVPPTPWFDRHSPVYALISRTDVSPGRANRTQPWFENPAHVSV